MPLLFVFRGDMHKRLLEAESGQVPGDFLYGYDQLQGEKSHVWAPRGEIDTLVRRALHAFEKPFARLTRLGFSLDVFGLFRRELKQAKVIFCPTDAIGLGLLFFKMTGRLDGRVMVLMQALPERLKYFKGNWPVVWFVGRLLKSADFVLTLSEAAQQPLLEVFGLPREKLRVFYFGVDTAFWTEAASPAREDFVLSVGNDINRDFATLVRALPIDASLKMVTSARPQAEGKQVEFLSGISDQQLRTLYQTAKFVVVPSIKLQFESSGLSTILQALHCGAPVIASFCPALGELFVDGEDLLFFEPGNAVSLAEKMERLSKDSKLRARLARQGRSKAAQRFTTAAMARQLEGFA